VRVAIDARPALDERKTGIGHYAQQIIRHLPRADPATEYTAWYLHAKGLLRPRRFFADVGAPNLSELATPFPARVFEPLGARLGLPRVEWFASFDALLATNFLPPATRSRGVVMVVHDLAFRLFPETAPQIDDRWLRRFRLRLLDAARIIVPSQSAARDLQELEGVPPERVEVVHHGVDVGRPSAAAEEEAVRRTYGIDGPYLLFLGGLEPRKNLPLLLRAFARMPLARASLVVAGGPVRWFPQTEGHVIRLASALPEHARSRVVVTGYVPDRHKAVLLSGATAFVYPSLYEGFGLPVLEAMACGTPVLTSNVSAMPEVAGDAALLVDPYDVTAIAGGMTALIDDDDLRDRLRRSGLERARAFTWEETARKTAEALHRAGAGDRG
jgi:glycosyltransferase involved in cell wall biosynthesis